MSILEHYCDRKGDNTDVWRKLVETEEEEKTNVRRVEPVLKS